MELPAPSPNAGAQILETLAQNESAGANDLLAG